jgi:hypothetical protein
MTPGGPSPVGGASGEGAPAWVHTMGTAAFLACSWTWCIGMYLPVLLLRDFGWVSFVLFALPNCLGAACMGVFLWRRTSAASLAGAHAHAVLAFSLVTALFQVWFLTALGARAALSPSHAGAPAWAWQACIAASVAGLLLGCLASGGPRSRAIASWLTLLASAALLLLWLAGPSPDGAAPTHTEPPAGLAGRALGLSGLAAACLFGFALCPYLDATFLGARRDTPGAAGSRAFLVGFLVLFPVMILWTLFYGWRALREGADDPRDAFAWPILAHIGLQTTFTAGVHVARAIPTAREVAGRWVWPFVLGVPLAGVPLGLALEVTLETTSYAGLSAFEVAYRVFMAFYGLVAPAYVYLCVLGPDGIRHSPDRRSWIVLSAAVALAAPCYWLGFIEGQARWLVPGVAIVLMAKVFTRPADRAPGPPFA